MTSINGPEPRMLGELANRSSSRVSQHVFIGVTALLFAASTAATILWCGSMAGMAGGWMLTTVWMRMPGQTWPGFAASFLGMWMVMTMAMMLPSLIPMLWRYRRVVDGSGRLGRLTVMVGAGYFFVWTVIGMIALPLGVTLTTVVMQHPVLARAIPFTQAVVILSAGMLQFTAWKARRLACCRETLGCGRRLSADIGTAWRYGLHLGIHCCRCCFSLMAVPLVIGVMDPRAMVAVTVAITAERLVPYGERIAHAIGVVAVAVGMLLIAQAVGVG